jgi:hypothetical protein
VGRDLLSDLGLMKAAAIGKVAPEGTLRLLADVQALGSPVQDSTTPRTPRVPALVRLEELLGQEFADRLVAALSADHRR